MTRLTIENYTRTYGRPIHANYRFEVQCQRPDQDYSWSLQLRTARSLTPNNTEALEFALDLQKQHPDWNVRIMCYEEVETLSEPYHPAFIRTMAGVKDE